MKNWVMYRAQFTDTSTGETFTSNRTLRGWRLAVVSFVILALNTPPRNYLTVPLAIFTALSFGFSLGLLLLT